MISLYALASIGFDWQVGLAQLNFKMAGWSYGQNQLGQRLG